MSPLVLYWWTFFVAISSYSFIALSWAIVHYCIMGSFAKAKATTILHSLIDQNKGYHFYLGEIISNSKAILINTWIKIKNLKVKRNINLCKSAKSVDKKRKFILRFTQICTNYNKMPCFILKKILNPIALGLIVYIYYYICKAILSANF